MRDPRWLLLLAAIAVLAVLWDPRGESGSPAAAGAAAVGVRAASTVPAAAAQRDPEPPGTGDDGAAADVAMPADAAPREITNFQCDGRTRCPQMSSCEEAEYFLRNCAGVELDGDGDGMPCEQQWCVD